MADHTDATVLIVDDDPDVAESYADRLNVKEVMHAGDGEAAMTKLDEGVDVVLLDRKMPGMNGDDVLQGIRKTEYNCRVAMLTGMEPELDVIDMGFDEYIQKPITREKLPNTVATLYHRSRYDTRLQRYFALASTAATLETNRDRTELAREERYAELRADLERLKQELDATITRLSTHDRYAIAAGEQVTS